MYLLLRGLCICLYLSQFNYNRVFSDCNFRSNFSLHWAWSFVGFNRERNWIFVEASYFREVCWKWRTNGEKYQISPSNGAKLHYTQPFKDSELIMAIKRRFFSIADIFITAGADLKHIGENGNSVLHVICKGRSAFQCVSLIN